MATIRRIASVLICLVTLTDACTSMAIGRKATKDGSVIIGQSEDGDVLADPRIIYVPARDYPEGAMAPVYYADGPFPRWVSNDLGPGYMPNNLTGPKVTVPIGYIPQVRHTYAYWDANYAIINEHNVAIDETTCSAMFYTCAKGDNRHCEPGRTEGSAILDSRMLTMFALERAKTAREAIRIMGDLAYEYGFYGTHDPNGDGESLMVGDTTEAWVFHILADPTGTKAIWAARRVPDDSFQITSNMFTIREVDVTDTENCMASPNIYSVAEERGWWKRGTPLDFTRIYSNGEYGNKYYAGRRMWRGMSLVAPSLNLQPEYSDLRYDRHWPWAVRPDKLLEISDIFNIYRDYYQGTKFDLTKGLAAGFGGTPDRFDTSTSLVGGWERSIGIWRGNIVKVQHLLAGKPREVAGVAWVAPGPPVYSPFLPIPSGLASPLNPLSDVDPAYFSSGSLNWAARKVMMTAQIRFDHMHPVVEKKQHEFEKLGAEALQRASESLAAGQTDAFADEFQSHTAKALAAWTQLSQDMYVHFSDNADVPKEVAIHEPNGVVLTQSPASLSYPTWWLKAVGYTDGELPPAELQCPPTCPGAFAASPLASSSFFLTAWGGVGLLALAMFGAGFRRLTSRQPNVGNSDAYCKLGVDAI